MMYVYKTIPKSDVPEGKSGPWEIQRFTVSEEAAKLHQLQCIFSFQAGRGVQPGTYTRLVKEQAFDPMMSDTPAEMNDHYWAVKDAVGNILVTGLGLGIVANAMLLKPEVNKVTVIEIDQDIINLVENHLKGKFGDRLEIIHADAFTWVPPKPRSRGMFDFAWHDIWPTICGDNWEEMKKLKRHYQNWVKHQRCWVEGWVKRLNNY